MTLFPKDYIALKMAIDRAIQTNQNFVYLKGVKLTLFTAKQMYINQPKDNHD